MLNFQDYTYCGSFERNGEIIETWKKVFPNEYEIVINIHSNEYGGKILVRVIPLPTFGEKVGHKYLSAPDLCFFATGFDDLENLEVKIKEEIVPTLKKWAILTI